MGVDRYQNPSSDVLYRVPANVYVADAPIAGGCYEVSSHRDYESYSSAISSHYDFNSRHTSQTKTTKKIMQRFFERDDSASLMYVCGLLFELFYCWGKINA